MQNTNRPEQFEQRDDLSVFRPAGEMSLPQAVQLITTGITYAREQGIRRLLLDTRGLTGFGPPPIAVRYYFIQQWARAARGQIRVAMIAKPEMIDPEKFGITVAANNGLAADVFMSEEPALAWLKNEPSPTYAKAAAPRDWALPQSES